VSETLQIAFPFPLMSNNRIYRKGRFKIKMSEDYLAFIARIRGLWWTMNASTGRGLPAPLLCPLAAEIRMRPPNEWSWQRWNRDAHNYAKATYDALARARVFDDDRQIVDSREVWSCLMPEGSKALVVLTLLPPTWRPEGMPAPASRPARRCKQCGGLLMEYTLGNLCSVCAGARTAAVRREDTENVMFDGEMEEGA
jgi:Holliday junction resolvase RusA-like endonuclease